MATNVNACCIHLGKGKTLYFPQGFLSQEVLQAGIQFGTMDSPIHVIPTVVSLGNQVQEARIDNSNSQGSSGKDVTPNIPNAGITEKHQGSFNYKVVVPIKESSSQISTKKVLSTTMKKEEAKSSLPSRGRRPNVVIANIPLSQEGSSNNDMPKEKQNISSFEVRVISTTEATDDTEEMAATSQTEESTRQQMINRQVQEQLQENQRALDRVVETQRSLRRGLAVIADRQLGQGLDIATLVQEMGHVKAAFEKMERIFERHEQRTTGEGQYSNIRPPTPQSEQDDTETTLSEHVQRTPYPAEYEQVPLPEGYIIPKFIQYDGTGDPRQHLIKYKAMCGLTAISNVHLLQQFELSLRGKAFEWYQELPGECIRTFGEMETMFLKQFAGKEIGNKKVKKLTLQQKIDKPKIVKKEELRTVFDHLIQTGFNLPEPKRPAEANQINHPFYCPYHRLIGHTLERCFVFNDKVEKLYKQDKLWIPDEFLAEAVEPSVESSDIPNPLTKRKDKGKKPM